MTLNDTVTGEVVVTKDMVNAYWDWHFTYQRNNPYGIEIYHRIVRRLSDPTWSFNCHGYSSGLGYWIQDIWPIWADGWQSRLSPAEYAAGDAFPDGELHSGRIEEMIDPLLSSHEYCIRKISEKEAYTGVYETQATSLLMGLPLLPIFVMYPLQ